jgi:hypothetical protein
MVANKPQKLMLKDSDFFENLEQVLAQKGQISSIILRFIRKSTCVDVSQDVRCLYQRKQIIQWMTIMKFLGISSIHSVIRGEWSSIVEVGKDVLYKVRNNEWINWRSMLLGQSYQCLKGIEIESCKGQDVSGIPCFIIDDTDIPKRGKCMEMIGKIFSHVSHSFQLGYKSLNLAYWSGKHLLHVDFSYHVEMGKKNNQGFKAKELKARYYKRRNSQSAGSRRFSELIKKKTMIAQSMIRRAIRQGFKASYVLADSWFFSSSLSAFALKENLHLISRPKFNNWKYQYQGKNYTIGALIKKLRYSKKIKTNRHLKLKFVCVEVEFKELVYQLIYFKEPGRKTKWQALITTDKNISAQRAFKIYQTRWAIESSYKELKQLLRLGKCQSRDFDAQISDATQCLMSYNILSHLKAIEEYQSIGALFEQCENQWLKPTLMQRFWKIFYQIIAELAQLIAKTVDELLNLLINNSKFIPTLQKFNLILTTET